MNFSLTLTGMVINAAFGIRGIGLSVSAHLYIIIGLIALYLIRRGWKRYKRRH